MACQCICPNPARRNRPACWILHPVQLPHCRCCCELHHKHQGCPLRCLYGRCQQRPPTRRGYGTSGTAPQWQMPDCGTRMGRQSTRGPCEQAAPSMFITLRSTWSTGVDKGTGNKGSDMTAHKLSSHLTTCLRRYPRPLPLLSVHMSSCRATHPHVQKLIDPGPPSLTNSFGDARCSPDHRSSSAQARPRHVIRTQPVAPHTPACAQRRRLRR